MVYIFSDGYADQFGGPKGKKYKYPQLKNLLLKLIQHPVDYQKQQIRQTFIDWKGHLEQVDDVCVLGLKV